MIIDFHSHLYNPELKSFGVPPPMMFEIPALLERQEQAGVTASVITNPMFGVAETLSGQELLDKVRRINEFAAELGAKYPGRFIPFATAIPFGPDEFLKEAERSVREYRLQGFYVSSSIKGEYLDSERAHPFYELVCQLDVPLFVHPPVAPLGADRMGQYRLVETLGRPFDTTLTISRMVFSGIFEKFPRLKAIFAHLAGAITLLPGRLEHSYGLRHLEHYGPWGGETLPKAPSEYLRQIYIDAMCFWSPALECALALVGADHLLLGSDTPPLEFPLTESIQPIEALPIAREDKDKILGGNALALLGMKSSDLGA